MAQRNEIVAVYAAGVIQGVALVTFPAASAIFSSPAYYGLSSTEYGGMFVPQAILAIASSLMGAGLTRRLGIKRIYLLGLVGNLLAMMFLVLSQFVMHNHPLAYGVLLIATTCMGIGFGLTVPAINTFAAAFFPHKVDKAVLVLNALLGVGTALAPVFVAIFVGFGIWWGLPVVVGVLAVSLLWLSSRLPLGETSRSGAAETQKGRVKLPARFWIFAMFALLYGICETMNGNWASLYMSKQLGSSATLASLALTTFWGAVTGGRILFAVVERWFPERRTCQVLPFVVASAFLAISFLPASRPDFGIAAFALAGLGCSALLPLTMSFAEEELTAIAAAVAGGLIAFYQIGYGIAAFGVGPLQSWAGLNLKTIYAGTAIFALVMSGLSFVVVRPPAAAHSSGTDVISRRRR
jgi:MFS family permease